MAGLYATYHGPDGLRRIATRVHRLTSILADGLESGGLEVVTRRFFDTITVHVPDGATQVAARARRQNINVRVVDADTIGVALKTTTRDVVERVWAAFGVHASVAAGRALRAIPENLERTSDFLTIPSSSGITPRQMLRTCGASPTVILRFDRTMIPLGSCTMKLNATSEMLPVTWPEFARLHPSPLDQAQGYLQLFAELESWLCDITGYDAVSLQPTPVHKVSSRAYWRSASTTRAAGGRDICLIPASAHGTNAASAAMAGLRVVVVECDEDGNVDFDDLKAKAHDHADRLAALMVTYPSTHGVFEHRIVDICAVVHEFGGQVYLDGANLNALVGVAKPGEFGADVSHLNLHKTFCIPHGGGGPGVGPIGVLEHLAPFYLARPGRRRARDGLGVISAAPWGSAAILPISWAYIAMMSGPGLRRATEVAILNANYVARRLSPHYPVLYTGPNGLIAHECVLDLRPLTQTTGVSVEDVAKRLIDFGFHAPTMSFPVAGTLMIEPTESEDLTELDRFCSAMITIRDEIRRVEEGEWSVEDSPLRNAPHPAADVAVDAWERPYSRDGAAFPVGVQQTEWPPVSRIDNVRDRNVMCACPPVTNYAEE